MGPKHDVGTQDVSLTAHLLARRGAGIFSGQQLACLSREPGVYCVGRRGVENM